MTKSTGVARILIVGDTPAFGKTVGAILETEAEDFSEIKRVLAGYLEKPEGHGSVVPSDQ